MTREDRAMVDGSCQWMNSMTSRKYQELCFLSLGGTRYRNRSKIAELHAPTHDFVILNLAVLSFVEHVADSSLISFQNEMLPSQTNITMLLRN